MDGGDFQSYPILAIDDGTTKRKRKDDDSDAEEEGKIEEDEDDLNEGDEDMVVYRKENPL